MRCEYCGSDLVEVDNPMRREFRHRRGVVCTGRAPEFKETAENLNVAADVQGGLNPAASTTDHLAETEPLSNEYLERIRSNAETWREMHDVMPEELMDIDVLLAEVDRARAEAASLRARLDTAEGRIAAVAALHAPVDFPAFGGSLIAPVCEHCRREDGGRVGMSCPTMRIVKGLDGSGVSR